MPESGDGRLATSGYKRVFCFGTRAIERFVEDDEYSQLITMSLSFSVTGEYKRRLAATLLVYCEC